jgi:hypothetical protein
MERGGGARSGLRPRRGLHARRSRACRAWSPQRDAGRAGRRPARRCCAAHRRQRRRRAASRPAATPEPAASLIRGLGDSRLDSASVHVSTDRGGRTAPSGQSRSPRSLPASCAGTCGPSGAPKTGGCSGCPRRPAQRKPLRPDRAPGPRRSHPGQAGTWPVRRPYDLRHAALSLWLAPGAPPAEIAARTGHSVRVLLTVYAHCIPGCGQIASQHIDRALNPQTLPPAGPQEPAQAPGIPSVMRPCHSWTQRDTAGPETSVQIRLHACDLRKYRPGRSVPWIAAPGRAVLGAPVP